MQKKKRIKSLLLRGIDRFAQANAVGVAETGAEGVARAMRGKCVRQRSKGKIGSFAAPHSFNYTTRANISHEITEQIRARIVCTPAEKWVARAWIR